MTRWLFRLRCQDFTSLDAASIRLAVMQPMTVAQAERQLIKLDGVAVPAGEVFDVRRDDHGDLASVVVEGSQDGIHGLATCHAGGEFRIEGNAGDGVGGSMTGGRVVVSGNVGASAAGPYLNGKTGMRGGVLEIQGAAGHYLGHRMRRGTVLVSGSAGMTAAASMVAGTIMISGTVGAHLAVGMRRGTVLLGDSAALTEGTVPTEEMKEDRGGRFSSPEEFDARFLHLYRASPAADFVKRFTAANGETLLRRRADRNVGGLGEILFPGR